MRDLSLGTETRHQGTVDPAASASCVTGTMLRPTAVDRL